MKATVPALSPLLRSNAQGDILALLFMNEGEEYSLADISRHVHALPATVHREVERLVASRILTDRSVGRARLVRANREDRMYLSLFDLLQLSYGPKAVLQPLLSDIPGIEQAFIYGSWAARYSGEVGPPPQDVDVLVVGTSPRERLESIAHEAQLRLRREVNLNRVSAEEWAKATQPFIVTVRSRPLVELDIEEKV
jgi:AraC-like DNA-binding protein